MEPSTEHDPRQDQADGNTAGTFARSCLDGGRQPMGIPSSRFMSTPVMQSCDGETSARKRPKVLPGPLCSPLFPHHSYATREESRRTDEGFSSRDSGFNESSSAPEEHSWATRSAGRVTALYAELVRELEAQVAELRQILVLRDEAATAKDWRIRELEKENQELRRQVQTLEEQNDSLSHRGVSAGKEGDRLPRPDRSSFGEVTSFVNDSNISFLRNLAGFLETSYNTQTCSSPVPSNDIQNSSAERISPPISLPPSEPGQPNSPSAVGGSPSEGMLRVSGVTSGFQYWMKMDESGGNAVPESCALWEEPLQETLPDGTPAWASPIESNGRPKLELVPASGVYITYQQLEDLSHIPRDKPKLMTRRLLDYFFSRETLARSSATGQRIAHNNTTMEKPLRLPDMVVAAIKAYVTRACGRGCNFNAVINSKCGTSRRAVKKMSIRIDWTEAGARHCHRAAPMSPAHRLQGVSEKALLLSATETDPAMSPCMSHDG
ncbi:uncharacterized protein PAF06_017654 [Gastrophryne carolinensis]